MKLLIWLNFLWAVAGGSQIDPCVKKNSQASWCILRILALERPAMLHGAYLKPQYCRDHLGTVLHIAILTLKWRAFHHGACLQLKHWRDQQGAMVHACNPSPGETRQVSLCVLSIPANGQTSQAQWCILAILALERPARCSGQAPWYMFGIPAMDSQQQIPRVWQPVILTTCLVPGLW